MKIVGEEFTIHIAAEMTARFGFCPMMVTPNGECAIMPMHEAVRLAKPAQRKIKKKLKELKRGGKTK